MGEMVVKRLPVACHVFGCHAPIPRTRLMCLPHWKLLPRELQRAVNHAWKIRKAFGHPPGLIRAHLDACAEAIAFVVKAEREP